MIDWHSHILPAIDDGSRNVAESIEMLRTMCRQGVNKVVATPHFLADDESVDSFLERRENSFQKLKQGIDNIKLSEEDFENNNFPEIIMGAEVKYYNGISRLNGLKQLALQNRNLLMIEMPMSKWTEYTVKELDELSRNYRLKIIIAHIERYESFQTFETMERLYESGILMQVNSSLFKNLFKKRSFIKRLERGEIHLIGSDCHNLTTRPPALKETFDYIERKLGNRFIKRFNSFGEEIISKINVN